MGHPAERIIKFAVDRHTYRDHDRVVPGQVTAVDTTNKRVSVRIKAEATATTGIPYVTQYTPAVNDFVAVQISGSRSYLVLGAINAIL